MKHSTSILIGVSCLWAATTSATTLIPSSFEQGQWLNPETPFSFRLQEDQPIAGRLVFFIDKKDVTALVRQTGVDEYSFAADILPLASGSQSLKLFSVDDSNQWQELAELPLNVLTTAGFEESENTARFDVTETSQFKQNVSGDAFASDPEQYHNMAMTAGFSTRQKRGAWEVRSRWNVVSTSVKQEALRFGQLQDKAPKTDLSDYLVEFESANTKLAFGHVNFGNHALLLNGLANRGVTGSYRAFGRLDFSVTSQSGQRITGYNNILGAKNYSTNSIQSAVMGFDFLKNSAAQLRAEVTYLTAEVTSDLNFNFGEVADSESSQGLGVMLTGQSSSGRLRGNALIAQSRYGNPEDPFLNQGLDVVETEETKDNAYIVQLDYDLLQPNYETGKGASLTVQLQHEKTDLLYKSVGAFVSPDVEASTLNLNGQLGQTSWQLQSKKSRDNLDDIQSVLTTVTEANSLSLNIPLQRDYENQKKWLPQNLSINSQKVHQFGDNLPIGFDPNSHIPDQVSVLHGANLSWQWGSQSFGYNISWSDQDNHQPGRAQADFRDVNHGLNFNFSLGQSFNIGLNLGAVIASDFEQNLKRYTDSASINLDWRIGNNIAISGNYGVSQGSDSEDFAESDNFTAQTQMTYRFELPLFSSKKLPGQIYLRHAVNDNYSIDNQFQFESQGRSWTLNGGFNISLF